MASPSSVNPETTAVTSPVSLWASEIVAPPEGGLWDVFLNFRGESRSLFTDHLYNVLDRSHLRTYIDRHELPPGGVIPDELIQAIKNSKTYVVVFSKDYADSHWCLDELVQIYKCFQESKNLVIGVYYHIKPSDVRHQKGSFETSFIKHQTGHYKDKIGQVNDWRLALKGVADFSGLTMSAKSDDVNNVDFINKIAALILKHVKPKTQNLGDHYEARRIVEVIKNTIRVPLSIDTVKGVIKIGFYGLGGVGKTTIAKALYNHLLESDFDASCFLDNVREIYGRPDGLLSLQNKLISGLLNIDTTNVVPNVGEGTEFTKTRFGKMKVLLVIDDVDDVDQCKDLLGPYAPKSVVIITTRNTTILDKIPVQVPHSHQFEVDLMNEDESLKLFRAHAFGDAKPRKDLENLSTQVLRHAGRLPLALAVFGSHLSGEPKEGWIEFINQLELYPIHDVEEKLIISYNALEKVHSELQDIFLDIACFFLGWKKKRVVQILGTCYTSSDYYIQILKKRSLLSINNRNELEMHGLLGKMGKEIARIKFSYKEPEKHSRLWLSEDIHDVLLEKKGTDLIQGIIPSNFDHGDALMKSKFTTDTFDNMKRLRFLYIKVAQLTGSFEQIFGSLKWLCWDSYTSTDLPSHFPPRKLVVLELPNSNIIKWELTEDFENLKTLNMSNSLNLTTLPDFSKLPNLETLNLEGCKSLAMFDILNGCLKKLVSLILRGCVNLGSICDSHRSLEALEVLDLSECEKLRLVPDNLWGIASFRKLELFKGGSLRSPFDHLELWNIPLTTLPSIIDQLLKVERVDISNSPRLVSLEYLPPNVKWLSVYSCKALKKVVLSNFTKLQEISLVFCSVTEIVGLEGLTSLQLLQLDDSVATYSMVRSVLEMPSPNVKKIYPWGSPDWITSRHNKVGHTLVHHQNYEMNDRFIAPDVHHKFLGIVLCLAIRDYGPSEYEDRYFYEVHNHTNSQRYSEVAIAYGKSTVMIIIPSSFISVTGNDIITVDTDGELEGFVLVYDD